MSPPPVTCHPTCHPICHLLPHLPQGEVFTCLARALHQVARDLPRRPLGRTLRVTYELCLAGQVGVDSVYSPHPHLASPRHHLAQG